MRHKKKVGWLTWVIVAFFFLLLFYFSFYKNSSSYSLDSIKYRNESYKTSLETKEPSCPLEMNKSHFWVIHHHLAGNFPSDASIEGNLTFSNKGRSYVSCRRGMFEGENVNYIYCGEKEGGLYFRNVQVSDEGIIQNKQSWHIKILGDIRECIDTSTISKQELIDKRQLPVYKCKYLSLECSPSKIYFS